jgi:hypothetical protein
MSRPFPFQRSADDLEGVPPLAPVSALLCALRSHPALREMLLVARTALAPGVRRPPRAHACRTLLRPAELRRPVCTGR